MASSGGVGAVRRTRSSIGRARVVGLVAVLGLFVAGTGTSGSGVGHASGPSIASALRLERHDADPAAELAASGAAGATPTTDAPVAAPVTEVTAGAVPVAVVVPAAAHGGERAIVAPRAFSRARPPARPVRTAFAPGPKEGGVWAVVVGIDDYPGDEADLKAASADARDVDSALAAYGVPASHRLLLLDGDATAENIRAGLAWMAGRAAADSTAVFFYSGHVRQVGGDPDRDGEAVDEAMVGSDGDNVYDGQMADILRNLDARNTWLGIAACYGGGFDDALAPGRILTAAAPENEVAYENSGLGHSYLVEYMVHRAMLGGKAAGSVQDAFGWARTQIARDYPNRQPVLMDRARGPVVLGRPAPPPAPERRPSPPPPSSPPDSREQPPTAPTTPAPTAPEPKPGGGACATVLGMSVCSGADEHPGRS